MEFDKDGNPITPEYTNQDASASPDNENWEGRFKDTQSAFTKAQTEKYEFATLAVNTDPKNILKITDEKVSKKILNEKWGVDNIEELNMLFPDALKDKKTPDEDFEEDKFEKLEREMKLWKYKETKTKTDEAIAQSIKSNENLAKAIPDIEDRLKEEIKNISQELPAQERVAKAMSIVINSDTQEANAYNLLRGITINKSQTEWGSSDVKFKAQQDALRKEVRNNNNI